MNRSQTVTILLSAVLVVSAVVGVAILTTDAYLWSTAPAHAEGLIAFVALDLILAVTVWRVTKLSILGAGLLGLVQFAAMAGDIFISPTATLPLNLWQQYILGDEKFIALLVVQPILVSVALATMASRRAEGMSFNPLKR